MLLLNNGITLYKFRNKVILQQSNRHTFFTMKTKTKAKEPHEKQDKTTSDYMVGCLGSNIYKEILRALYEFQLDGLRPKEVFDAVSKKITDYC